MAAVPEAVTRSSWRATAVVEPQGSCRRLPVRVHGKSTRTSLGSHRYIAAAFCCNAAAASASVVKKRRPLRGARCALQAAPTVALTKSIPGISERTEAFLRSVEPTPGAPGKGGDATLEGVRRANEMWRRIRERAERHAAGEAPAEPPRIVQREPSGAAVTVSDSTLFADVVICGGTLGIFVAGALQAAGLQVCVIERGVIKGRDQEWNLNKAELGPLIAEGVVSAADVEAAVVSDWPASRVGVRGEYAMEFKAPALNAGVSPAKLVEAARSRFERAGGQVVERASLKSVKVYDDVAVIEVEDGSVQIRTQLVIDAMGAGSPIVAQARGNMPPDAACLVVGTMASGFPQERNQQGGDYLYSCGPIVSRGYQPFWESFPAAAGGPSGTDRTTYYFAYALPGASDLPEITDVLEDYVEALPTYQDVDIEELTVRRVLAATFIAYRDSPLNSRFDRVMQVGDAAGIQSPLSFGGFGALCRHLSRVRAGVVEALQVKATSKEDLSLLNPHMPNLSLQWAMYRSIARPPAGDREFVNRVLGGMLSAASTCGDKVLIPILQDVFSLQSLGTTLLSWLQKDPGVIPALFMSMGLENVAAAIGSLLGLAWYTTLTVVIVPVLSPAAELLPEKERFRWRRNVEAWRYGSGLDFEH